MYRGTTPTITINVKGETFDNSTIFVTLAQDSVEITKTGEDVVKTVVGENSTLSIYLTQEETLSLTKGNARIQIRWINSDGSAFASPIKVIGVDTILLEGVIEHAS